MKKIFILALLLAVILSGCLPVKVLEKKPLPDETVEEQVEPVQEEPAVKQKPVSVLEGKIIVVDAGHGISGVSRQEQIAPGSSETKSAFATGTAGANQTEEQLNLAVALKLQEVLSEKGAVVHMTRTGHETDKSNIDRAVFANELNADISVKIHADGSNNPSVSGVSMLVPGVQYVNEAIVQTSRKAGELVLESIIKETGANNRGISVRNDMTGFNWSEVPIILVEMGFMTNPTEDALMETDEYQQKIVSGIVKGLEAYFG